MFTEPDTWNGGYFELTMEIGFRDDERLRGGVVALWDHPALAGCYLDFTREPEQQSRLGPSSQPLETNLYGIATTPTGREVACRSYTAINRFDEGADWLYLLIPLGSLGNVYPVGAYPFDDGASRDWILPISEWLRQIGETVFESVPFRLGLVGWEIDYQLDSQKVQQEGVPDNRWIGYLWPDAQSLHWYPPNRLEAPMTLEKKS